MYTAIAIIIVIVSILLTLVVLVQNSKGGGLAANFASGNQTFGVRKTADFLEKATWTLAIIVIVLCIAATATVSTKLTGRASGLKDKIENSSNINNQPQFPVAPSTEAPASEIETLNNNTGDTTK